MGKIEQREKWAAFIVGIAASMFVLINIYFKGFSYSNLFDALKDICSFAVSIIIVFMASKIIRRYTDFKSKFETYLEDWVKQNDYLIDSNLKIRGKEDDKVFYYMLSKPNHKNFVFNEKKAYDFPDTGGHVNPKGAFLYTDVKEKQEIIFGLNKSAFVSKGGEVLPYPLIDIANQFTKRINEEFKDSLNIKAEVQNNEGTRIKVSIKNMEKTEENAKKLIDIVDFVKTMILAFA